MKHLNLELERLEQRIAPGGINTDCCESSKGSKDCREKGNNGYGNGGDDPAPGNSGKTGDGKPEDVVR